MVKVLAYIRVIRFEGVPNISSCLVLQSDDSIENLLPIVSEKRIKLLPDIKYQVVAESENGKFSVSFSSALFEDDGMFWLPLFTTNEDFLTIQPEEVSAPRVLILAHKKVVEEGKSNLVTEESALDYEFMPEIKLDYCENTIIIHEDKYPDYADSLSIKEHSQLSFDTDEKPLYTSKDPETHPTIPEHQSDKLIEISVYYQESLNNHKKLAENMIREIENKNQQLSEAMNEITHLKTQVQKIELENNYLKTMANGFIGIQITELVNQLQFYKEKVKELDNSHNFSPIEEIAKNECTKMGLDPPVKDNEEVFVLNGKKLNLFLKAGKLFCRNGTGCKEFRQVIMELNSENQPVVNNSSKSPFRKNLGEFNSCADTPRGMSKGIGDGKLRKSTPSGRKTAKPLKRNV